MSIPNAGLTADQAEALFKLAHNGVLTRIDERGHRCGDLYQWGLHPHHAESGSPLAADNAAFAAAYPLTLAGPHAVAEHAMFPAISAVESMNTAGCWLRAADRTGSPTNQRSCSCAGWRWSPPP